LTLIAAYGRAYKSKKEIQADFDAGKDFMITGIDWDSGRYVNKADLLRVGERSVMVRYARLTKVVEIKVKP
jgi:hypothetical protein